LNYTYLFDYHRNIEAPLHKRRKVEHYSAEIIIEIVDLKNLVPIRALLDTGTSETILLKCFLSPNSPKGYKGASVMWKTLGGNFTTHRRAKIQFAFPELSDKKTISWVVHVDQHTHPNIVMYDMIIGMDCMCSLGIYVNSDKKKVITWEGNSIQLKERGKLQEPGLFHYQYSMSIDASPVLIEAGERQSSILDANYDKIEPDIYVTGLNHLSPSVQEELSMTLKKNPILFGGGLGLLRIKPVHLTLREDAKPVHARAFPIPQSLLKTTKMEVKQLTKIEVFEKAYDSEWAAPTFVHPKKTGDVRILTDFRALNACQTESDKILGGISPIYSHTMLATRVAQSVRIIAQVASKTRHSKVTPEHVARAWNIGLDRAKETLRVTTQKGIRYAIHPIHR
jgi:hypothetical protein